MPRTLLVAGDGAGLRRASARARALGLDVVAASRDRPDAEHPAGGRPDEGGERLVALAAEVRADGIVAASPATAAASAVAAAALGFPGPGAKAAAPLGSRIALRRQLALAGVAQPRFAAVRTVHEGHAALATVGVPAVLKPAEPGSSAAVRRVDSGDDLDASLYLALAASEAEEAIVESFHDGHAVEALCLVTEGAVAVLAVVDRADASGDTRVYPSALFGDALDGTERAASHALHALSFRNGVASVHVVTAPGPPVVVDAGLWTPWDPLDVLVRVATGVDPLELALRTALGVDVPTLLVRPRFHRAAALRRPGDGSPAYAVVEAATNLEALELATATAGEPQPDEAADEPSSHEAASAASSPADRQTPPRSATPSSTRK